MDFWASLDHKLRYKIVDRVSDEIKMGTLECSKDIYELDLKMQSLYDLLKNND